MSAIADADRPRPSEKLTLSRPSVRSIPVMLRLSELDRLLPSDPPRCLLDSIVVRRLGSAPSSAAADSDLGVSSEFCSVFDMEQAVVKELFKLLFMPLRPPARLRGAGSPSLSFEASSLVVALAVAIMMPS
mmetsp:Transcript_26933/g.38531  ORF Transcript_26933/g.38531 Transcript_26933/m.38531 type:complete len:131 (+) Transcript_26933:306-698(+)